MISYSTNGRRALVFETLECRHLLAADPLPVDDLGLTDQAAAQLDQAQLWDTARLAEHFGTGAELELDVFNVRTDSPATTVNVGDVILVRVRESVPAEGGTAPYLFPVFLRAFVGLGYDTDAFTHHPRAYQLADTVELPERTGVLRTNALVAGESGILGLISVAETVPDGFTAANPNRVEDLQSRPEVAAYLASVIHHAALDLEVVDTAQRPVANDDSYEFVWPWGSGGITDPAVGVSAADGVLANDSAPQGAPLRAVLLDVPRHGRLQLNADGSFRYQPNRSLSGSDSFSYVAISEEGTSEIRTVTIVGAYPPIVNVDLRAVSPDGRPLTHVKIGETFFVEMVASATNDSTMLQPITARFGFDADVIMPAGEVEFNPEFGKLEFEIVTGADGDRTLESETVEPTGGLDHGTIRMHVAGFRLEPIFHVEKQVFRIGFTADAAGDVEFQFTDFSTRSLGSHLFNLHSAVLTVTPGSVWQNPRMPLDVNADGIISPLDVLVGINRLNAARDRNLGEERSATDPDHTFPDANGDGIHSPLDVLVIINRLNQRSPAEGEASIMAARPLPTYNSSGELPASAAPSSETNLQPRDEMLSAWAMPTLEDELLDSLTGDHQARPMDDEGDMKEQTDLLSVDELLDNTMRNHWELL